ncbi:MAG: protein kinase [Blastocatellia bacterium]|nr:protein kinase [Blastocatellia bacterium]
MSTSRDLYKGTILIVDDNPNNLQLLSKMLIEKNYRLRLAGSGLHALASVNASPPDLIMLDINMPVIDGYEVCQRLKAETRTSAIPIIFISALDEAVDKVKAFQFGASDYITKPFQVEEVLARIENQLKISRLQRDLENKNAELQRKNEELIRSQNELRHSYNEVKSIFSTLSDLLPGSVLGGKYRLDSKIDAGGYGVIYKATHLDLYKTVAVKIFRPRVGNTSSLDLERFQIEGIAACRINHPNAVNILDAGISENNIPYLVMEFLQGQTLADELELTSKIELGRTLNLILQVCGALVAAHSAGIIHRDIKPENIFLHNTTEGELVKVVDFGIAKLQADISGLSRKFVTDETDIVGTANYVSPERLTGKPYDGRSDVYSLGIMFYEMLSGRLPFYSETGDKMEVAMMHVTRMPEPLSKVAPEVPFDVSHIVMKTLAKDPILRPTAKELEEELNLYTKREGK